MKVSRSTPSPGEMYLPKGSFSLKLRDYLLAAIPHLIAGFSLFLFESDVFLWLATQNPMANQGVGFALFALYGFGLVKAFKLAKRENWPIWWGAWLFYFGFIIFIGFVYLITSSGIEGWFNENNLHIFFIAFSTAFFLYMAIRMKPIYGLLAGIPISALLGIVNFESAPVTQRLVVTGIVWLCVTAATIIILRIGRARYGIIAGVIFCAIVYLPYSWVGTYGGGMLDSIAPGPSFQQLVRNYLPLLSLGGIVILGPQIAWQIRWLGQDADYFGPWRSRFALFGVLVMLTGSILLIWNFMSSKNYGPLAVLLLGGGSVLFGLGYLLVIYSTNIEVDKLWSIGLFVSTLLLPLVLIGGVPGIMSAIMTNIKIQLPTLPYYPEAAYHACQFGWVIFSLFVLVFSPKTKRIPPGTD